MNRPTLTEREAFLLSALQLMHGWVLHRLEPLIPGTVVAYGPLQRDMAIASRAISEATGGNEQ